MIKQEYVKTRKDGVEIWKTYSDDSTKLIQKVGTDEVYEEAYDVYPIRFEYFEVDKPEDVEIDKPEEV